jgi:NitT/TauT family transport system ATP-binding protein
MAQKGDILLSVKDVALRLGGALILNGLSLEVKNRQREGTTTGQIVGILGPSGVGKTRLLRIIAGLDAPDAGTVTSNHGLSCQPGEVGLVFQNYPLLRHRTALSNLEVVGRMNGLKSAAATKRAFELLDGFRLTERARLYPAQLSGGQRQRLAIAQQLVCPKTLLLLDEPFSGLDPVSLDEVMHLIAEVANLNDINTVLLVTHDIRAAIAVSDTLHMLGRSRAADGLHIPGARIQATHDLVELGLAWNSSLTKTADFLEFERKVRAEFQDL